MTIMWVTHEGKGMLRAHSQAHLCWEAGETALHEISAKVGDAPHGTMKRLTGRREEQEESRRKQREVAPVTAKGEQTQMA